MLAPPHGMPASSKLSSSPMEGVRHRVAFHVCVVQSGAASSVITKRCNIHSVNCESSLKPDKSGHDLVAHRFSNYPCCCDVFVYDSCCMKPLPLQVPVVDPSKTIAAMSTPPQSPQPYFSGGTGEAGEDRIASSNTRLAVPSHWTICELL